MNHIIKHTIIQLANGHRVYWYGKTRKREVALTFDDGPDENITPLILDILEKAEAKATFFVIGEKLVNNAGIIRRIVENGHDIGNHTYSHQSTHDLCWGTLQKELIKTDELLHKISGGTIKYFRPPKGECSFLGLLRCVLSCPKKIIFWDVDPKDYKTLSWQEIITNLHREPIKKGSIILLHDRCMQTAMALPDIIQFLRRAGFRLVTLSELLGE
ncbi:MAG: polysaccharide deacetylase family protein [Pseudomonadota bacterium]